MLLLGTVETLLLLLSWPPATRGDSTRVLRTYEPRTGAEAGFCALEDEGALELLTALPSTPAGLTAGADEPVRGLR